MADIGSADSASEGDTEPDDEPILLQFPHPFTCVPLSRGKLKRDKRHRPHALDPLYRYHFVGTTASDRSKSTLYFYYQYSERPRTLDAVYASLSALHRACLGAVVNWLIRQQYVGIKLSELHVQLLQKHGIQPPVCFQVCEAPYIHLAFTRAAWADLQQALETHYRHTMGQSSFVSNGYEYYL
jgi:hypothetical protein